MMPNEAVKSEEVSGDKAIPAVEAAGEAAAPARRSDSFRRRTPYPAKKKVCRFCAENAHEIDYKQIQLLRTFMSDTGKILSSRITGTCASHQRVLSRMIKRARNLSLLPYVVK
jgi:small subunit ribosomal protein S18